MTGRALHTLHKKHLLLIEWETLVYYLEFLAYFGQQIVLILMK